jgi:hypothetical protein
VKVAIGIVFDHELARVKPVVEYLTTKYVLFIESAFEPAAQNHVGGTYSANPPTQLIPLTL